MNIYVFANIWELLCLLLFPILNVYFYSKFTGGYKWKKAVVSISIAFQILRVILMISSNELTDEAIQILDYWIYLTILVSPLVTAYWIIYRVKNIPQRVLVVVIVLFVLLGLLWHARVVYHLYWTWYLGIEGVG